MRGLIARPAGLSAENLLVSFVSLLRIIYSSDFQDAKDSREGHFFNTIGAKRTKVSLDGKKLPLPMDPQHKSVTSACRLLWDG